MSATRRDLLTGIVIVVVGTVYFLATFAIRETTDIVTPRTFPAIVGTGLIVLGLLLAVSAVRNGRRVPDRAGDPVEAGNPAAPRSRAVVGRFALFFAYLAIVIPVGFVLSTTVFLMAMTSLSAPGRWVRNLIYSVLFSVVVYVVFVFGLAVYLPVGILG